MASTYLQLSASDPQGSNTTGTFSFWVKRAKLGSHQVIHQHYYSSTYESQIKFRDTDVFEFHTYSNGWSNLYKSNRVFRDTNAWYHFVIAINTTLSTAGDRIKVWVNNERITSWETETQPSQNSSVMIDGGLGYYTRIGSTNVPDNHFDGSLSHFHYINGTAYDPTSFGETDSTTGEWKIKTDVTGVTYGSKGWFVLENGNSVTDQSPNTNNFTVGGGTLTKTEDNPSNVFATLNPLAGNTDATFSHGNTKVTFGTASSRSIVSTTLGAINGRYYWEMKVAGAVYANNITAGVGTKYDYDASSNAVGSYAETWGITPWNGQVMNNGSSVGGTWATFASGDIMQFAINLVEEQSGLNKFYIGKNGTWLNGADPSNHSSTTGVVGITKPENGSSGFLFPLFGDAGDSATPAPEVNFGNGYFGTTAVSSAGTNASGNGIFEYDVPTGYTALSTKGLNL